jgi:hypothetical protein
MATSTSQLDRRLTNAALPIIVGVTGHRDLRDEDIPELEQRVRDIRHYGPERDRQYAQVGAYIVRYSQILIALWDSTDTGLEGGTAQIVGFKLNGIAEPYAPPHNPLDAIDAGPVYHLMTPRRKSAQPPENALSLNISFPGDGQDAAALKQANDRLLSHLNAFNREAQRLAGSWRCKSKRAKTMSSRRKSRTHCPLPPAPFLSNTAWRIRWRCIFRTGAGGH